VTHQTFLHVIWLMRLHYRAAICSN
jgi:hypothetical protein